MRLAITALAAAALASGQAPVTSETNVYTFDANGRRQPWSASVTTTNASEQRGETLNGHTAALERVEERVLRQDASGRLVERVLRPFDATGRPGPPVKYVIEERRSPDGSLTTETQVLEGTINGSFTLREKVTAVARKSGSVETVATQVARPTLNGSVEVVERREGRTVVAGEHARSEEETVLRKDLNGGFRPTAREVKQIQGDAAQTVENAARYIAAPDGQLVLAGQTVTETQKRGGGDELTRISVFGMNAPGRPAGDKPQLREVQIIEKKSAGGRTVETFSIRRPALDDARSLGPEKKISERVCTGNCH